MITFTGARHTPIYYLSKKTDDKITKKEDHATKSNLSGMIKTLRAPKRKGFPIGYVYERVLIKLILNHTILDHRLTKSKFLYRKDYTGNVYLKSLGQETFQIQFMLNTL